MNTKNLKARIHGLLDANVWISTTDVGAKLGITAENARYYLEQLVESGEAEQDSQIVRHLDSNASSRRFIYRLADMSQVVWSLVPVTPPAYRNLRLSESLTNYDRTNHDFAALCMMVRK
jgi:hypothetical protein